MWIKVLIFDRIKFDGGFSLVDKTNPNMGHHIVENAIGSDFITSIKHQDINPLVNILPAHIINRIKAIPSSFSGIKDKTK